MLQFLQENLATILVSLALLAALILILRKLIRQNNRPRLLCLRVQLRRLPRRPLLRCVQRKQAAGKAGTAAKLIFQTNAIADPPFRCPNLG